jgi:hypothetical protein
MTFQQTVQRQYTTGFPGEIVRDGPKRAKAARINSATVGIDPGASTNRISRAFGYTSEVPATGITYSASDALVDVGGPTFFGILGNPKHYASAGNSANGTLAPTLDLPKGHEAEFFDMATGIVLELFNETTGTKTTNYGDQIAYVLNTITVGQNALALPYGALISVPAGSAAPAGFKLIPNAEVVNSTTLSASALGSLVSGYTIGQLTQ